MLLRRASLFMMTVSPLNDGLMELQFLSVDQAGVDVALSGSADDWSGIAIKSETSPRDSSSSYHLHMCPSNYRILWRQFTGIQQMNQMDIRNDTIRYDTESLMRTKKLTVLTRDN